MADMKALFTQRFDAARTALTQGDDPAAAESLHWAIVAARGDSSLRRELASALFHLGKLSRKFGRAGETEAEQLLTEALAVSEELFGMQHAALVPVLTELSRVHVQRSQHARAEQALERLLAIARVKGEENADVAIALAGLAAVKRKLGDDASAESLYRDALRIREKVLEPNHMVTVVTLEQLSETCAARGNFAEAVALLRRALPTREESLGAGHETVRATRSRVAELELQVAIAADAAAVAAARTARGAMRTPVWFKAASTSPAETPPTDTLLRIDSKELESLGEPEPRVLRPAPPRRERAKTPTVAAAVAAASLMASPMQTPSAPLIAISPLESVRPSASVTSRELGAAHRDAALADVAHGDVASGDAALVDAAPVDAALVDAALGDVALGDRESSIALVHADFPEPAPKKRRALYASAGVAAAAIAIAGLMLRPSAGGGSKPVSAEQSTVAPVVTAAATRTGSIATGAAAMVGATRADSFRSASTTPAHTAPVVQPERRGPESAQPELRVPRIQINVGPMNAPSIPAAPNVDSIVRSATERQRASDTDRSGTGVGAPLPTPADVDDAPTPPKIIGRAPAPRFPDELLRSVRSEGEVVVRFRVNELGSVDVASMIVVRSDHELFTAAVRNILPRFRFEPARTHAPESKPVAAWVGMPFRFTTKK